MKRELENGLLLVVDEQTNQYQVLKYGNVIESGIFPEDDDEQRELVKSIRNQYQK